VADFRVTILAENCVASSRVIGEHGFSALIEKGGRRFLFDTGQGMCLPHNVKVMGEEFSGLEAVALSHGHYDHTGGLRWVIEKTGGIPVFAHRSVFARHMGRDPQDPAAAPYDIGCPFKREDLEALGARFHFEERTRRIGEGLWFITGISRKSELEPQDPRLVIPGEKGFIPDPMEDDASLLVDSPAGALLILGCAHAGILNILEHVRSEMGFKRLWGILGGTHLLHASEDMIRRVAESLDTFYPEFIAVSHCTGWKATAGLFTHFKDRFRMAAAGTGFSF
jgi:7,8-dihydropterin-6-yl-methyl-4-(beta-D-ribofuranosyl)aminobenzene 5'-phosphate synthase